MNKLVIATVALLFVIAFIQATSPQLSEKPNKPKRGACAKECFDQFKKDSDKDQVKSCITACWKKVTKKFTAMKKKSKKEAPVAKEQVESDSMIGGGVTLRATTSVNVRNGACTNKGIIRTLSPGETVKSTGWSGSDCGYLWYGIHGSFGYGYVAANYMAEVGGGGPSPSPAPSGTFNCGQAYVNGRAIGEKNCVKIDNENVVDSIAAVFNTMKNAAAQSGVHLKINSGFRTQSEQQYVYNCYITKRCNNGNLAAAPGYSNHQNGIALDIDLGGNAYNWLARNASRFGFVRTVPSETWHWEYRPGTGCNAFVSFSCS